MLFLSCTANFIVHVFPSNSFRLQSAAEVSHKHYLVVSLALATGSMQLQQFQESVGSPCSLGWLPVLSSNMRGLTLLRWGVPDLHGLLSFPHAHSSQTAHTLQATRQHAAWARRRHSRVEKRGREIPVFQLSPAWHSKLQTHSFTV